MENQKETTPPPPPPPIFDQLKEYAETQIEIAKLEAIDKSAKFLANSVTDLIVAVIFVLTFLFLSFAIAFLLSRLLGSHWAGFGCMAGIYLIIGIIIIQLKDKMQVPLVNLFIKRFLN